MTRHRWFILALVFLINTNNYLDRIVFSVLIPVIRNDLHISTAQYGNVMAVFQLLYTAGFLFMGNLIDRWGTRIGYSVSIVAWSVAAAMHAAARSALSLGFWRGLLGLGESGNFPASVKAVAEWFPMKDRAYATGLFNSGSAIASVVGPPLFAWMAISFGWRTCFLVTGGIGFVLVAIWWVVYRLPEMCRSVNKTESDYIKSDADEADVNEPKIGYLAALRHKETWGFSLAKFLTDPVWWFYLYWLPPYLFDVRKFNLTEMGWALPVVYVTAGFGSALGGRLSGFLMGLGWTTGTARKTAMGICAGLMPLGALSVLAHSPIVAIVGISIACAAHQGWSANLFTTTSDVFPKAAVASVTGFGGGLGGFGGVIFSSLLPAYIVAHFGYTPIFLLMGGMHLVSLVIVQLLMGRMQRIQA